MLKFTHSWGQERFSDVFNFLENNTLSRSELTYDEGTMRSVHYGDVLIKYNEILNASTDSIPYIRNLGSQYTKGSKLLADGDIIFADTAEDETVGKCTEIRNIEDINVVSGLHTFPCRPKQRFGAGYLGFYLNSSAYHNQLLPYMQGIKVTSLSRSSMSNTLISYPKSIDEQQKIGDLFLSIDSLLTLHQRKHNLLNNVAFY